MIASVFSKSKPINFVLVAVFIALFVGGAGIVRAGFNNFDISKGVINLLLILFSLFLMEFVNSKNNLTQNNSYAILFFGLFAALFPNILEQHNYLWSNLFIIFALRRLISLQSRKHIKKKLFDASFWIAIAALFNPWTILFFVLVIIAVLYYSGNDIKNVLTPLVGLTCVFVLKVCYNIITYDEYLLTSDFLITLPKNFGYFVQIKTLLVLVPFTLLVFWSLFQFIISHKDRNTQFRPSYMLVLTALCTAITVCLFSNNHNGAVLVYSFVPASLLIALGIEQLERMELINLIVTLFILLPFLAQFV